MPRSSPATSDLTVRPATPDDLAALKAIAEAAFAPYVARIGRRPAPMDAAFEDAIAAGDVLVAERAGIVVGYAAARCRAPVAELDAVAVRPEAQGGGTGTALVAAAEARARGAGAHTMALYTNAAMERNLRLYPRLGYRMVGRRAQEGFDRVFFEKTLSPPPAIATRPAVEGLFGRRRVHGHRPDATYARYALDLGAPPAALFPGRALRLEVGFGAGEHLVHHALGAPEIGLIGVEPFETGVRRAVRALEENGLGNVRLFMGDARDVLDWLPPAALERVDILYPDPWPKRRHWKRRFVSVAGLDRLARALGPGSTVRFASDIASYMDWTRAHVAAHPAFTLAADSDTAWPGWPGTRYEAKALREGRRPRYLTLRRVAAADPVHGSRG